MLIGLVCALDASSFFCWVMLTCTLPGLGGIHHGGFAVWSSCSSRVDERVKSAVVWCILQSCECLVSAVSQSLWWRSTSIPEWNSGGMLLDDHSHIGWDSGRVMVRMSYFRHACWSRISGGGSDASISMGMAGEVRNAPRIRLLARSEERRVGKEC